MSNRSRQKRADYRNRIFIHSSEQMHELPDESVQCIITSPPYYMLRDYQANGQIGMEATFAEYLDRLASVFAECYRVLRRDGVMYVNIGDTYVSRKRGSDKGWDKSRLTNPGRVQKRQAASLLRDKDRAGLQYKSLYGVPWRLALRLVDEGWILRSDIVWAKPNGMPNSMDDRPTLSHEYVFMFSKRPRYFWDGEPIREPLADSSLRRLSQNVGEQRGSSRANGGSRSGRPMRAVQRRGRAVTPENDDAHDGFDDRWSWDCRELVGANARSVWNIATTPYFGDHYAVFPEELVRRCLLSGTPPHVCGRCKKPYHRSDAESNLLGWVASCKCEAAPARALVLDPFGGTGRTATVAVANGRDYALYEIQPAFLGQINEQLGLFSPSVEVPAQRAAQLEGQQELELLSVTA